MERKSTTKRLKYHNRTKFHFFLTAVRKCRKLFIPDIQETICNKLMCIVFNYRSSR